MFALSLFKFVPIFLTKLVLGFDLGQDDISVGDSVLFSALEGVMKAGIMVGYILLIRLMKDVRRVFQYHGAEHKTINAYEAGSDLSVANVVKYPTFHPRCGTSFLFAVILFSLLFAMMFPLLTLWLFGDPKLALNLGVRFGMHLIFLPVIASLGYEFIRFTGRFACDNPFMVVLTYPGRLFQKITALEPEDDMVEVSLVSMHLAMGLPVPDELQQAPNTPDSEAQAELMTADTGSTE